MDRGRILDQGSPRALIRRHVEPEVVEIRGQAETIVAELGHQNGCRLERMGMSLYCYTRDARALLGRLQEAHDLTFVHRPAGLEDVFLRLTGRELRD